MNTLDIEVKIKIHNFEELYSWAKKQFLAFEVVEGVIPEATDEAWAKHDFSIDCSSDQMMFKDMLQIRFVEELSEASVDTENWDHFSEEVTDALNFFLTSYLMLGTDFSKLPDPEKYLAGSKCLEEYSPHSKDEPFSEYLNEYFYGLVEATGYLCNLLKNRPWSQSNYLVSMIEFNERLESLWIKFWDCLGFLGFSKEMIFDLFAKKLSVNFFRIESKY